MSVLSDITTLHFINNTNHFIEVRFNGEQNASLHVTHNCKNIITQTDSSPYAMLMALLFGTETKLVHVNLPIKQKSTLKIKCRSNLFFEVTPKIPNTTEVTTGSFELKNEYQNNELEIHFQESAGVGYTEDGDIAINANVPVARDLLINTKIQMDSIDLNIETEPAFCKVNLNN